MEDTNAEVRADLEAEIGKVKGERNELRMREQQITVALEHLRQCEAETKQAMAKLEEILDLIKTLVPQEKREAKEVFDVHFKYSPPVPIKKAGDDEI